MRVASFSTTKGRAHLWLGVGVYVYVYMCICLYVYIYIYIYIYSEGQVGGAHESEDVGDDEGPSAPGVRV